MAAVTSAALASAASCTSIEFFSRFTAALATPGTALVAFSTRAEQAAHVIPWTLKDIFMVYLLLEFRNWGGFGGAAGGRTSIGRKAVGVHQTSSGQAATSVGVERLTTGRTPGKQAAERPAEWQAANHTGYSRKLHGRQLDRVRETADGMPTGLTGQHCLSDRTKSSRHPIGHQPNWRQ